MDELGYKFEEKKDTRMFTIKKLFPRRNSFLGKRNSYYGW